MATLPRPCAKCVTAEFADDADSDELQYVALAGSRIGHLERPADSFRQSAWANIATGGRRTYCGLPMDGRRWYPVL